ncbi:hypothetical protein [Vibrio hangzhouensis]|uniref:Uncharacterized protein n=1 Tax=Vibrio hangzhouensis TaxID=462991 RepID=A0A1H6CJA3_9VIBR|nr:hypothetical protein [Vibrio hangzhouensis]MBY6198937.1 hypothetical protein [Vibrio hangzhouensis]SEG73029.1 hypothetical protein SAMN04488244_1421 [Vibrio hangzhouensis]
MNRVIHVPAHFCEVGKHETVDYSDEPVWTKTGYSKSVVDSVRLTEDLQKAVETLNQDGFEVISITPITSGDYDFKALLEPGGRGDNGYGGYGYGYGYSYTQGLIVTARQVSVAERPTPKPY